MRRIQYLRRSILQWLLGLVGIPKQLVDFPQIEKASYPVDQSPVPALHQKGESFQQPAQEIPLKSSRIRRRHFPRQTPHPKRPRPILRFLRNQQTRRTSPRLCLLITKHIRPPPCPQNPSPTLHIIGNPPHIRRSSPSSPRIEFTIDPCATKQQNYDHNGFSYGTNSTHAELQCHC